jgi:hypothetical protein
MVWAAGRSEIALGDENSNSILSSAELEAAIAEVETEPASAALPSLSEQEEQRVVPVPGPPPAVGRARAPDAAPDESSGFVAQAEPAPVESAPAAQVDAVAESAARERSRPGFLGRLISLLPFARRRSHVAADVPAESSSSKPNVIYRAVDTLLAVINRPFAALGPTVRDTVGIVGLVTIVMCVVAGALLPHWMAPPDPVALIREKLEQKPPPAQPEASAKPEAASHNSH